MNEFSTPSRSALFRDVVVLMVKLWMDGIKDVVLMPVCLFAAGVDFVFRTRLFYRVLGMGERFDLWLNLFGAAKAAGRDRDGLFGASRAGDSTLLGRLEQMAGGDRPVRRTASARRS